MQERLEVLPGRVGEKIAAHAFGVVEESETYARVQEMSAEEIGRAGRETASRRYHGDRIGQNGSP